MSPLTDHMSAADAELVAGWLRYQEGRSFSVHTVNRRRYALQRFARHMAPASIMTAEPVDVDEWMTRLTSARTRHAYRTDLNGFYRWCIRRDLAETNPVEETDSIRVPKPLPKPAPAEALAAAFTAADSDGQLALMLGALAGLRIGEIVALDRADVHLDAVPPVIHVRDGKGGKDRIVPAHPLLVRLISSRPAGWLFPSPTTGRHVTAESMRRHLNRVLDRAGIERFTPHQLRHRFGTDAARISGGNLLLVAEMMGHSSTNTTRGYTAWSPEQAAEVVAQFTAGEQHDDLAVRRRARAG